MNLNFLLFFCISFLILITFGLEIIAQPGYEMSIKNGETINDHTIEFDVFIKSTGTNFSLTSYQCVLSFDQFIINNGDITFTYLAGTSQLSVLPPVNVIGVLNNYGINFLTFASVPPGNETISSVSKKVGRFKLTNTNRFLGNGFNIWWQFSGFAPTIITGINYSDITNSSNHINFLSAESFPLTVLVQNNWNIVSIPGLHPDNQNINTWWENRKPGTNVFQFNGGYSSVTTVEPGKGYWMKHTGNQEYSTGNQWPEDGILYAPYSSLNVNAGWNLIGGYDYGANISHITTIPEGSQMGFIFGYSSMTGYSIPNALFPGYGYWIKLSNNAQIILPPPDPLGISKINNFNNESWGKIIITDAAERNYILYVVNYDLNLNDYQLPPAPHTEMFDIRFSSGRFVETIKAGIQTIEMSGVEYPVKIKVENTNIRIQEYSEKSSLIKLNSGEEILINSIINNKLIVSSDVIPDEYLLEQNYPNPFNPSTTIEFSIPEGSGNIRLVIYNALGQQVTELVNAKLDAGRYSFNWNAQNFASGLYLYELRSEKFFTIKKMLLLK